VDGPLAAERLTRVIECLLASGITEGARTTRAPGRQGPQGPQGLQGEPSGGQRHLTYRSAFVEMHRLDRS
jgi:hypothetical protein